MKVCGKQYLVNVSFPGGEPAADAPCPNYARINPSQIDGVPPTLIAALNKGEIPAKSQAQSPAPVAVAAAAPQAPARQAPQPFAAVMADSSASPVVTRPAAAQTPGFQQTKQPVAPVYASAQKAPAFAPASSVQPVNYRFGDTSASAPAPRPAAIAQAQEPSKDADPDSLQKPNRTGKGGKLGGSSPAGSGDAQAVNMGFAGQQ